MLMMMDRPRYAPPVSGFSRFRSVVRAALGFIDAVLLWPQRALENRRLLDRLGTMSEHELRDIGLTRQDLRDATALPSRRDPGVLFAARAAARRVSPGRRTG